MSGLGLRRSARRRAQAQADEAARAHFGSADLKARDATVYNAAPVYEPLFVGADGLGKKISFSAHAPGIDDGEQALLRVIRANLGTRAESLTIRLMNRAPLKAGVHYSYLIEQDHEERDLLLIEREMTSGRLSRVGMVLQGGAWSRVLLGPRFSAGSSRKQIHELSYRRRRCSCLVCLVQRGRNPVTVPNMDSVQEPIKAELLPTSDFAFDPLVVSPMDPSDVIQVPEHSNLELSNEQMRQNGGIIAGGSGSIVGSSGGSTGFRNETADINRFRERAMSMPVVRSIDEYTMENEDRSPSTLDYVQVRRQTQIPLAPASTARTPSTSNPDSWRPDTFMAPARHGSVQRLPIPPAADLHRCIGADVCYGELQLGELTRLNVRGGAKLKFDDDIRPMIRDIAYIGPLTGNQLYTKVLSMGMEYQKLNRGKKQRKVYVRGDLVKVPVEVGVTKIPRKPMRADEVGSTFILHARQTMTLYQGTIMFEGNQIGSHVDTGLEFYIGFGIDGGAAAIYPEGRAMGARRRLGINELLLHVTMKDDMIVQCR